jgi:hypothetical protein
MPEPPYRHDEPRARQVDRPIRRLVAIIVSAGLAWAIAVALAAWIVGQLLSRA